MPKVNRYGISIHYGILLCICALLVVFALVLDTPQQIISGYYKINTSRSILVTDYIVLGGIGATLMNSALSGFLFLFLLIMSRREPDGKIIAALWTAMGFSFFGKNFLNMLPILAGVFLYGRVRKIEFSQLFVQAMLSATIAPLVSEIAFLTETFSLTRMMIAYGVGVLVGFIFPVVVEAVKRMHTGYCLYNSGIAGGFIATFCVGLLKSVGVEIISENKWDTAHTPLLAALAFAVAVMLIAYGMISDKPGNALKKFWQLQSENNKDDNDYLVKYGNACYLNIGAMCILATSAMLLLKVPINGPVLGGIFTVAGFSASGKHLRSTIPILLGSVIATHLNHLEQATPANSLAMLFSTGLAPIAGKHGWPWGIGVGFLHVSVAIFIGQLNGGLNLYNNGFAGSFVAITIVPLILFFKEVFADHKRYSKARDPLTPPQFSPESEVR